MRNLRRKPAVYPSGFDFSVSKEGWFDRNGRQIPANEGGKVTDASMGWSTQIVSEEDENEEYSDDRVAVDGVTNQAPGPDLRVIPLTMLVCPFLTA